MTGPDWTRGWEGLRLACYDDSTGKVLQAGEVPQGVPTIGYGHTGSDVAPGDIWTQFMANTAFAGDYGVARDAAIRALGFAVDPLGDARLAVLTDLAFEMGYTGLRDFRLMLSALRGGLWKISSFQLLDSDYAKQSPRRAKANAEILEFGVFPAVHPNDPSLT